MELKDNKTEQRKNRFNGESIMLTKEEAIIHDRIFINEMEATLEDQDAGVDGTSKLWDKVRADINWFRKNNAEAYMVLLDQTNLSCPGANAPRRTYIYYINRGTTPNPNKLCNYINDTPFYKKGSHFSRLYCLFQTDKGGIILLHW